MKKSDLWTGIVFLAAGVGCLLAAVAADTQMGSVLCGLAGGMGVPGAVQIYKYLKWSRPENAAAYRERLEQEKIELQDERKALLRSRAGQLAYAFNLALGCAGILALSVLDRLGVVFENRWVLAVLSGWILVQYAAGILFYQMLSRRY